MAGRSISRDLYDKLLAAFREKPGNASYASKRAGCDRRMAARGWELGWTELGKANSWAIPIREALLLEQEEARARKLQIEEAARKADQDKREKARQDSINALTQEAQAVAMARGNTIALNAVTGNVIKAMVPVVERLRASLESSTLDPKTTIHLMARMGYLVRQAAESARLVLEMERLRIGDPREVLDSMPNTAGMSPREAAEELGRLAKTLERAKAKGFTVIEGGLPLKASNDGE